MAKNTMIELVTELEKLNDTPLRERLIQSAKEGDFHDWQSKSTCGKMFFVECAQWFYGNIKKVLPERDAANDIAIMKQLEKDIKSGIYDEEMTDFDRKTMINEIQSDNNLSQKDKQFLTAVMKL